jgi:hypothetical protein
LRSLKSRNGYKTGSKDSALAKLDGVNLLEEQVKSSQWYGLSFPVVRSMKPAYTISMDTHILGTRMCKGITLV